MGGTKITKAGRQRRGRAKANSHVKCSSHENRSHAPKISRNAVDFMWVFVQCESARHISAKPAFGVFFLARRDNPDYGAASDTNGKERVKQSYAYPDMFATLKSIASSISWNIEVFHIFENTPTQYNRVGVSVCLPRFGKELGAYPFFFSKSAINSTSDRTHSTGHAL